MNRLTILFDADDVAEMLLDSWVNTLNDRYGTSVCVEDVTDWDVSLAFPTLTKEQIYGVLQDSELWSNLTPMPGAQECLQRLYDEGHDLYMVTATDYRTCRAKIERILELFPFLDVNHIIIAHNKQMIKGDILIDDGPHNLINGDYRKILFDRPHNRKFDAAANDMLRVKSWKEIDVAVHVYADYFVLHEEEFPWLITSHSTQTDVQDVKC